MMIIICGNWFTPVLSELGINAHTLLTAGETCEVEFEQ